MESERMKTSGNSGKLKTDGHVAFSFQTLEETASQSISWRMEYICQILVCLCSVGMIPHLYVEGHWKLKTCALAIVLSWWCVRWFYKKTLQDQVLKLGIGWEAHALGVLENPNYYDGSRPNQTYQGLRLFSWQALSLTRE